MRDRDLYANILGISALWQYSDVVLGVAAGAVEVLVEHHGKAVESMHARIQRIQRIACGYRNRERFRDVINLQLAGPDFQTRPVSALTISRSAANLLSENCSTESDISRVGRTTRDPTPTVLVAARSVSAGWISTRGRSQPTRLPEAPDFYGRASPLSGRSRHSRSASADRPWATRASRR